MADVGKPYWLGYGERKQSARRYAVKTFTGIETGTFHTLAHKDVKEPQS
jgi:hypothetical protein